MAREGSTSTLPAELDTGRGKGARALTGLGTAASAGEHLWGALRGARAPGRTSEASQMASASLGTSSTAWCIPLYSLVHPTWPAPRRGLGCTRFTFKAFSRPRRLPVGATSRPLVFRPSWPVPLTGCSLRRRCAWAGAGAGALTAATLLRCLEQACPPCRYARTLARSLQKLKKQTATPDPGRPARTCAGGAHRRLTAPPGDLSCISYSRREASPWKR